MTVTRWICLLLVVAAAPLAGAHARAQAGASPALAIIVHPSNPVENLTFSELRRIFNVYKPMIPYYEERPTNPLIAGWRDWLKSQGHQIGGAR